MNRQLINEKLILWKIKNGYEVLSKSRGYDVGIVRTWSDGKRYKKMDNGKWVRVYDNNQKAKNEIKELIKNTKKLIKKVMIYTIE